MWGRLRNYVGNKDVDSVCQATFDLLFAGRRLPRGRHNVHSYAEAIHLSITAEVRDLERISTLEVALIHERGDRRIVSPNVTPYFLQVTLQVISHHVSHDRLLISVH